MTDYNEELSDVMNAVFTNYKGCLIEKTQTGYLVFGKEVPTMLEAKMKIEAAFKNFQNL